MKALFIAINILIGTLGAALGVAILVNLFNAPDKLAFALIGVGLLAMAAVCCCIGRACCFGERRPEHLAV
ncbi:MAG: hypothetical protein Q8J72_10335 [Rhodocyclaceae bacterium]|jgi:hypothetical protein|nr:hypothetical protein [Rhodocyclaceae bacterium]MDP2196366.1 hypothetical protein [Rhodocyclaceae bacterium]